MISKSNFNIPGKYWSPLALLLSSQAFPQSNLPFCDATFPPESRNCIIQSKYFSGVLTGYWRGDFDNSKGGIATIDGMVLQEDAKMIGSWCRPDINCCPRLQIGASTIQADVCYTVTPVDAVSESCRDSFDNQRISFHLGYGQNRSGSYFLNPSYLHNQQVSPTTCYWVGSRVGAEKRLPITTYPGNYPSGNKPLPKPTACPADGDKTLEAGTDNRISFATLSEDKALDCLTTGTGALSLQFGLRYRPSFAALGDGWAPSLLLANLNSAPAQAKQPALAANHWQSGHSRRIYLRRILSVQTNSNLNVLSLVTEYGATYDFKAPSNTSSDFNLLPVDGIGYALSNVKYELKYLLNSNTLSFKYPDGAIDTFNGNGELIEHQPRGGAKITLAYTRASGSDVVTRKSLRLPNGKGIDVDYQTLSGKNVPVQVTEIGVSNPRSSRLIYDTNSGANGSYSSGVQLTRFEDASNANSGLRVYRFQYDNLDRMIKQWEPGQSNPITLSYRDATSKKVFRETQADGSYIQFDEPANSSFNTLNVTHVSGSSKRRYKYERDLDGRITRAYQPVAIY